MTKQNHLIANAKSAVPSFGYGFLLLLSLFITFLCLSSATAAEKNAAIATIPTVKATEQKAQISLTQEEREWLRENPHIRLATLTNQPPFSMMDWDGNHTGMLADILTLLSNAIGQKIEPKLVENIVSDTHEVAKEKGIYGSASILNTSRHANEYLLTDPYFTTPFYIYATAKNRSEISRPADLSGKRVAVPRNHRAVAAYLAGISGVQMVLADTPLEQMQKVVSGDADALIGYMTYPYLVNKYLMVDLVMAFIAKSDQGIRIGVNPEHPVLHGILNKAIATIGDERIAIITAKWTEISREETPEVELTNGEQTWLAEHPEIVLGAPTDYPPMVIKRADGTHVGALVDFFELVSRRLNTRIRLHIEDSWGDIQEKAQNREIDGLAFGGRDPGRDALYNATDIVLPTYFSVFARSQHEYQLKRFSDLKGMRIGYKRAARPTRSLLEKLPSPILKPYDDHESLTQALLSREIDVIVAWMSYDHWRKQKLQGTIDNILLIKEYPIEMVTYIRKDWPELIPILNKAIAVLQQGDLPRINNKWFGEWPQKSKATSVSLTPEERAWLKQDHTVRVRVVNFPPYMFLEEDKIKGIVIDYLNLIAQRTGVTFEFSPETRPWQEALKSLMNLQGPDLMTSLSPIAEREPYMDFSEPYIVSARVIFNRTEGEFTSSIDDLKGRTLAVPHGTLVHKRIEVEYPDIGLLLYDTDLESIEAVSMGKADAYIGNLINASYEILQRGFANLKVAAPSPFGDDIHTFGIRRDWPELSSIINKGLENITPEEKAAILSKHLKLKYEYGIKPGDILKWVLMAAGSTSLILLLVLFWNRSLAKQINERTSELVSSKESLEAEIDERRQAEEKLLESRDYLKRLTDSMADAVFSVRMPERKIEWANDTFKILGYEPDECVGRTTEFLYPDTEGFMELADKLARCTAEGKEILHIEQMLRKKNGEIFPADITFSLFLQNGELVRITGIVRNISERKQKEQQLQQYQQRLKALASQLTIAEEKERRAIAADLHDHVGQSLALARVQLASARTSTSDSKLADKLDNISDTLLESLEDTQKLMLELSSPSMHESGLSSAISEWLESQIGNRHSLKTEVIDNIPDNRGKTLDLNVRTILFRNVRELLVNVVKHARAVKVSVRLEDRNKSIRIIVEDDGIGFEPRAVNLEGDKIGGFGLFSIEELMADLGGDLKIVSEPGKGCTAILSVPVSVDDSQERD